MKVDLRLGLSGTAIESPISVLRIVQWSVLSGRDIISYLVRCIVFHDVHENVHHNALSVRDESHVVQERVRDVRTDPSCHSKSLPRS